MFLFIDKNIHNSKNCDKENIRSFGLPFPSSKILQFKVKIKNILLGNHIIKSNINAPSRGKL